MAPLKQKGDWAELEVARDLVRRGFRIAIPYGEDWDFDLLFQRPGFDAIERVQVKYATARNGVIPVRCKSHSLTNGRVRLIKRYTAAMIDWLAVFSPSTDRCYYIPADDLGAGRQHHASAPRGDAKLPAEGHPVRSRLRGPTANAHGHDDGASRARTGDLGVAKPRSPN